MSKKNPPEAMPLEEPEWIFPFSQMQVGQSFFIPTLRPAYMLYAIQNGAKREGIGVKVHKTTEDGFLGVRAWRVN